MFCVELIVRRANFSCVCGCNFLLVGTAFSCNLLVRKSVLSLVAVACFASGCCAVVFEFACVIKVRCIQLYVYLIATLVHVVFSCV